MFFYHRRPKLALLRGYRPALKCHILKYRQSFFTRNRFLAMTKPKVFIPSAGCQQRRYGIVKRAEKSRFLSTFPRLRRRGLFDPVSISHRFCWQLGTLSETWPAWEYFVRMFRNIMLYCDIRLLQHTVYRKERFHSKVFFS